MAGGAIIQGERLLALVARAAVPSLVHLGVRHRRGPHLVTFALTENIQNINNTPDVGVQLGWSFAPRWN